MPPKKRQQVSAKEQLEALLRKKTLRQNMLRKRMSQQQQTAPIPSTSANLPRENISPAENCPPILLRTARNIQRPLNFKISFTTTATSDNSREIKSFELTKSRQRTKKPWPKLVCNFDIGLVSVNSTDAIMNGATLSQHVDLSSPIKSPIESQTNTPSTSCHRVPITAPSSSYPFSCNNSSTLDQISSTLSQDGNDSKSTTFLVPTQRRLNLVPNKTQTFKVPNLPKVDLRNKITYCNAPLTAQLKSFEDDSISLCAPTIIETDDDDIIDRVESPSSYPNSLLISPSKEAEIRDWVQSASVSSDTNETKSNSPNSNSNNSSSSSERSNQLNYRVNSPKTIDSTITKVINNSLNISLSDTTITKSQVNENVGVNNVFESSRVTTNAQPWNEVSLPTNSYSNSPGIKPIFSGNQQINNLKTTKITNQTFHNETSYRSTNNHNNNNQLGYYNNNYNRPRVPHNTNRIRPPNQKYYQQNMQFQCRNSTSPPGFRRMTSTIKPTNTILANLIPKFDSSVPPPNFGNRSGFWKPIAEVQQNNSAEFNYISKQQEVQQAIPKIWQDLVKLCPSHFREGNCAGNCMKAHDSSRELLQSVQALNCQELKKVVNELIKDGMFRVVSENLKTFLTTYVLNRDMSAILELVPPILLRNQSRYNNIKELFFALTHLNFDFKDVILSILNVGRSNKELVDILFSISIEFFTPSRWHTIETLLEAADPVVDHGVFSELCKKCIDMNDTITLIALAQKLATEPCKVDVSKLEKGMLRRVWEQLPLPESTGIRNRLLSKFPLELTGTPNFVLETMSFKDVDERVGWGGGVLVGRPAEDPQLPTISSTIPGPSHSLFSPVSMQMPTTSNSAHVTLQMGRNIERKKNSCSPDSSSYAANSISNISNRTSTPFSPPPPLLPPFSTKPPLKSPPRNVQNQPKNRRFLPYENSKYNRTSSEYNYYSERSSFTKTASESGRYSKFQENSIKQPVNRNLFSAVIFDNSRNVTQDNVERGCLQEESSGYSSENSSLLPSKNQFEHLKNQIERESTKSSEKQDMFKAKSIFNTTNGKELSEKLNISPEKSSEKYSPTCSLNTFHDPNISGEISPENSVRNSSKDSFDQSVEMLPVSPEIPQNPPSDIGTRCLPEYYQQILLTPRKQQTIVNSSNSIPSLHTPPHSLPDPFFIHPSLHHASVTPQLPPIHNSGITPTPPKSCFSSGSRSPRSDHSTTSSLANTINTNAYDTRQLRISIEKSQYNNLANYITKEKEASVIVICKMLNRGEVPVDVAYLCFDVLWDHREHFLQNNQYVKGVLLNILFDIYEFLLNKSNYGDAANLLSTRFSSEKKLFLKYKTFLPSGQCSPMQKCYKAVKLLLHEKMLSACYDWFILSEYHTVNVHSDMNNKTLLEEQSELVNHFFQVSHRLDLKTGFKLALFCVQKEIGDFKKHYNNIVISMINSTDHQEMVINHKEDFYNDLYVYLSNRMLRSYIVEFYAHLNLVELLLIYDIISRDDTYPTLTGHEHIINMRDILGETEIRLVLTVFLHRLVENHTQYHNQVTWDVNVRFYATRFEALPNCSDTPNVYPRNLLMCSNNSEAVKRLVNMLQSSNFAQTTPGTKYNASPTDGTVVLLRDFVKEMCRNYNGPQTFT